MAKNDNRRIIFQNFLMTEKQFVDMYKVWIETIEKDTIVQQLRTFEEQMALLEAKDPTRSPEVTYKTLIQTWDRIEASLLGNNVVKVMGFANLDGITPTGDTYSFMGVVNESEIVGHKGNSFNLSSASFKNIRKRIAKVTEGAENYKAIQQFIEIENLFQQHFQNLKNSLLTYDFDSHDICLKIDEIFPENSVFHFHAKENFMRHARDYNLYTYFYEKNSKNKGKNLNKSSPGQFAESFLRHLAF